MTDAGVYDELEELEKLMDEYCHFETTQPENLEKLQSLILEKVVQANLQDEVFLMKKSLLMITSWVCITILLI